MNLTNLKRMYNHILENVPEEKIDMEKFRDDDDFINHECGSTGCVIGHCVILDDYKNLPFFNGKIFFKLWSEEFTGINRKELIWNWCFSSNWSNNKEQILLRIKYLIDNKCVPYHFESYDYILPTIKLEPYELD